MQITSREEKCGLMTFSINFFQKIRKNFRLRKIYIFHLLIMVSVIFPVRGEPNQIRLHLAHGVTDDHPTNIAALEVQKEIALRTDDRIRLEIFSNMQFGEEAELIVLLQKSRLDIGIISTGPLSAYNPDLDILDLPYLFDNRQQAYEIWDGEAGTAILERFKASGLKGICYWENGLRSLTTRNTPVKTPADLKNMPIRTMENSIYVNFFSYLGALPTPIPWGQVTPSFQAGIIEAQENPIPIIVTNHLENYQRFLILTRHVFNPHLVLFGPSLNEKLTPGEINTLSKIFYDFRLKQRQYLVEQEINGLKTLQEKGMVVIEPDLTEFRKLGKEFSRAALTRFAKEIRIYFERRLEQ